MEFNFIKNRVYKSRQRSLFFIEREGPLYKFIKASYNEDFSSDEEFIYSKVTLNAENTLDRGVLEILHISYNMSDYSAYNVKVRINNCINSINLFGFANAKRSLQGKEGFTIMNIFPNNVCSLDGIARDCITIKSNKGILTFVLDEVTLYADINKNKFQKKRKVIRKSSLVKIKNNKGTKLSKSRIYKVKSVITKYSIYKNNHFADIQEVRLLMKDTSIVNDEVHRVRLNNLKLIDNLK